MFRVQLLYRSIVDVGLDCICTIRVHTQVFYREDYSHYKIVYLPYEM